LEGYRNFCNKIWNAARYVLMNIDDYQPSQTNKNYSIFDRWINSRLQETISQVNLHFNQYRFDLIAQSLYEFIWHEYCDWYLELSKPILTSNQSTPAELQGTRETLVTVLETILRLLHPLMPFITEEIWQQIKSYAGKDDATIMLQPYPQTNASAIDKNLEHEIDWLKLFIIGIRNIRGEMNISPAKQFTVILHKGSTEDRARVERNHRFLMALAKLSDIIWLESNATIPPSATALVGDLELLIPLSDLIDKDAEIKRLSKEIEKLTLDLTKSASRLDNPNYVAKAPADVVAKERSRVAEMQIAEKRLREKLTEIKEI
jgi:valyl-tRNA synthetase